MATSLLPAPSSSPASWRGDLRLQPLDPFDDSDDDASEDDALSSGDDAYEALRHLFVSHASWSEASEILAGPPGGLFLGGAGAGCSKPYLLRNRVGLVVNCSLVPFETPQLGADFLEQTGARCVELQLSDDCEQVMGEAMHAGADAIAETLDAGQGVLVHCVMGMSRSTTILAAFLIKHRRMSLHDAMRLVRSKRDIAYPNVNFYRQLIDFELSVLGSNSVSLAAVNALHRGSEHRSPARRLKQALLASRKVAGTRELDVAFSAAAAERERRAGGGGATGGLAVAGEVTRGESGGSNGTTLPLPMRTGTEVVAAAETAEARL